MHGKLSGCWNTWREVAMEGATNAMLEVADGCEAEWSVWWVAGGNSGDEGGFATCYRYIRM